MPTQYCCMHAHHAVMQRRGGMHACSDGGDAMHCIGRSSHSQSKQAGSSTTGRRRPDTATAAPPSASPLAGVFHVKEKRRLAASNFKCSCLAVEEIRQHQLEKADASRANSARQSPSSSELIKRAERFMIPIDHIASAIDEAEE